MCTNSTPAMVTPSSVACVKSIDPMRPGTCSCGKYTSLSGPRSARHSRTRRCNVRICPGSNTPGLFRHSSAKMVFASSLPSLSATSSGSISKDHTSTNGSGRVRHVRGSFVADGSGPRCHLRAVLSLIDAAAAAASIVLFSIRFFLSKRTCVSLTIRGLQEPRHTGPGLPPAPPPSHTPSCTLDPPAEVVVARRQK